MLKKILPFIFCVSGFVFSQDVNLPHYLTDSEKRSANLYQPPVSVRGIQEPPPIAVRAMAEWEELAGILLTWTSYPAILSQIVDYAQEEGLVYIVCSDSNQVKNYLRIRNIPLVNLVFLIEPYNSIWCRDYGPWTAYADNTDSLFIIDWIYNRPRASDDLIPSAIASELSVPIFEAVNDPDDLVHTGGNFMVDGHGNAFSSKLILDENPDKNEQDIDDIASRYLGVSQFIKMDNLPYDEIHHIDMHMKLLDEETLLVGEYPAGVADGPQIEANLQYILNNFQTCYGRAYQVVRIPMPPDRNGRYPDANGDYRTYTNSLIVNNTVIVPVYEERYDTTALRIYREAMPGYKIVGIDCNDIIPALGAIHCITKEIGVRNPVFISHATIRQAFDQQVSYPVGTVIRSNSGVSSASVFWSADTTTGFMELPMIAADNDSFIAQIPGQPAGTKIFYYIAAISGAGRTATKPPVAPAGLYSFTIEGASSIVNAQCPVPAFELLQNYPNPFNPKTTIRYSVGTNNNSPMLVELSVYDILGHKVATLVSEKQPSGSYQVEWDAGGFAGGVYLSKLSTDQGFSQTMKLVLIK